MSKSNLRQPKSFNFGFPDGSSDSEEEKSSQKSEEIMEEIKKPPPFSQMFKKKAIPTLASTSFDEEATFDKSDEAIKGSGTTGATSDSENQQISTSSNFEEIKVSVESKTQKKSGAGKSAIMMNQKKGIKPLFAGGNQKLLNIDTDAINELFNYGGEKGQIMMSEDEEIK